MPYAPLSTSDRARSGLGAATIVALTGVVLVIGLRVDPRAAVRQGLQTFALAPDPPPPTPAPPPPHHAARRPQGAAAPPNLRSRATEVAAPKPILPPPPPKLVTAPKAAQSLDPSSGAADRAGPGTGAGGVGNGFGSGGGGDGDGDGDGGDTPPRWKSGRLKDSDYPKDAGRSGISGTVSVRYVVEEDGRVTHCQVTHSSGSALLDATTCRLIEQRFRYRPSLDSDGEPVRSIIEEDHSWLIDRRAADDEDR